MFAAMDLRGAGVREAGRRGLVHVIEGHRVFTQLSVSDNLLLAGYDLPRAARMARVEEALELFPEIAAVWPGENPFQTDRQALLKATRAELGPAGRQYNFNAYDDHRSVFRYDMHTLPDEIDGAGIGTSTLLAAWNAATVRCVAARATT